MTKGFCSKNGCATWTKIKEKNVSFVNNCTDHLRLRPFQTSYDVFMRGEPNSHIGVILGDGDTRYRYMTSLILNQKKLNFSIV